LGFEGNLPKEKHPNPDESKEPAEPEQESFPPHFHCLCQQISQMMDNKFEQQHQYLEQRCE
jgi:hypothetical protein